MNPFKVETKDIAKIQDKLLFQAHKKIPKILQSIEDGNKLSEKYKDEIKSLAEKVVKDF